MEVSPNVRCGQPICDSDVILSGIQSVDLIESFANSPIFKEKHQGLESPKSIPENFKFAVKDAAAQQFKRNKEQKDRCDTGASDSIPPEGLIGSILKTEGEDTEMNAAMFQSITTPKFHEDKRIFMMGVGETGVARPTASDFESS